VAEDVVDGVLPEEREPVWLALGVPVRVPEDVCVGVVDGERV